MIFRVLFITILFFILACQRSASVYEEQYPAFGTLVNIVIVGEDKEQARRQAWYVVKDLKYLHSAWHPWEPGSLARANNLLHLGGRFTYAPSTYDLIEQGMELSQRSEGLFNPAMGKLIKLWGFHQDLEPQQTPPDKKDIEEWLSHKVKMSDLVVDGLYLRSKNPHIVLDFGAFAKGLAVDKTINSLKRMGVKNAIVNAGGDLRAIGKRLDRAWRVGVKHPRQNRVMASIEVEGDESVFTSGDYERYFMHEGKRFHHILDPRSGYPAMDFISVTVIHQQGALADAAATALFVAGEKDWRRIAKKMGIEQVMIVTRDKRIYLSPAIKKRVRFAPKLDLQVVQDDSW